MSHAGSEDALGWVDVFRALRHRTLNRLQVAYGWAQLGEEEAARAALEEHLLEEQRLSALLASGDSPQQDTLLRLLAQCERDGRVVRLRGDAAAIGAPALQDLLSALRSAIESGGGEPLEIALTVDGARVVRGEVGGC